MRATRAVLTWFVDIYTVPVAILLFLSGAVSLFFDASELKKKGLERDRRAAVIVGVGSIVIAPTLWVLVQLLAPK